MDNNSQENSVLKLGPNNSGQVLYFFGARHTNDPVDTQFSYLKKSFSEFMSIGKGERIVFVEGAIREVPQNYEEAILKHGEAGAIQQLAREVNIVANCPEPNDIEQRKSLCLLFDPQLVVYALIAQNLSGWFRSARQSSFEDAINRSLIREAKFSEVYGFLPDITWLNDQQKYLFGKQELEDKKFLDSISDPRKTGTQINNIIAARTGIRNDHLLTTIAEAWKSQKSIFIVYGKGHFTVLEQSLRDIVAKA